MKTPLWHSHPTVRTGDKLTLGERAADAAVRGMGSWLFLGAQTIFIVAWCALNVVAFADHWDPYPFILLNLAFSVQAAYAAPLILLASRRIDQRNSEASEHDREVNRENNAMLKQLTAR